MAQSGASPKNGWLNHGLLLVGWTLLVAGSLIFNLSRLEKETLNTAIAAARANVNKDIGFRKWGASHGGVYVSPTATTPPNPYLQVPGRNVVTTSGKKLTLMNPAYMLRQMQSEYGKEYGIRSRITSLKPLNPDNAPDEWEAKALKEFEKGSIEVLELQAIDGEPFLRLMLPFRVDEGCLLCHAHQGYAVGDIRGGVASAVSMISYYANQKISAEGLQLTHGAIWLIGFVGLGFFSRRSRKQEARRSASEKVLRLTRNSVDAASDAVFWITPDASIVDANPAACHSLGYSLEELVKLRVPDVDIHYDAVVWPKHFTELRKQGSLKFESEQRRKDGSVFPVEVSANFIQFGDEELICAFVRDIAQRKHVEAELVRYRQELEVLVNERTAVLEERTNQLSQTQFALDRVGIGVAWNDIATGRFLYANEEACRQLGYTREELLQLTVSDINPDFPVHAVRQLADNMQLSGHSIKIETAHRRKDGSIYPVEVTAQLHHADDEAWFIAFYNDMTERKAIETSLTIAKEAAEAANRAKSTFLANMSHELRTPMNAIMGMTSIVLRHTEDPKLRDQLGMIDNASQHLLSVINDILDISKIEAERLTLEESNFMLGEVLDNLTSLIGHKAADKGLQLRSDLPPEIARLALRGDPLRLGQILLNLNANAVKFTEVGTVTLRVRLVEENPADVLLRFEVQDTGIGISPEDQKRLFTAFEQADSSMTRKYGGTGLGLTISKRLAKLMGGDIGAESQLGVGSTFWFTVWLGKAPAANTALPPEPTISRQAADERILDEYAGTRILLAEDEPINQEVSRGLLEEAGLLVDLAEDGVVAVAMAKQNRYALILMDMQMPNMNGIDATRAIRALPGYTETPILAMTANAFNEDRRVCIEAGMNDHISKPVDPDKMFKTLLKWLSQLRT